MKRVKPYEYSFTAAQVNAANDLWGCNCGPTALAGMLGLKLDEVRSHLPDFDARRYTNPTMMQKALRSLGVTWTITDDSELRKNFAEQGIAVSPQDMARLNLPRYGLARIQWEGPWLKPGVPPAAAYYHTHWIGSIRDDTGEHFFDCNNGWSGYCRWIEEVVTPITSKIKRATGGWHPTHCWELEI